MSVSNSELAVLKELWDGGPGTVRELRDRLERAGRRWACTTVQTLLGRLQARSFAQVEDRAGRTRTFCATVSREDLLRDELNALAQRMCDGAKTPLVFTLIDGRTFSQSEIMALRAALERLEQVEQLGHRGGSEPAGAQRKN